MLVTAKRQGDLSLEVKKKRRMEETKICYSTPIKKVGLGEVGGIQACE